MKFIAHKSKGGKLKGDSAFCCRILHVSRQGFYQYLVNKDHPWKYQPLADAMMEILMADELELTKKIRGGTTDRILQKDIIYTEGWLDTKNPD